MLAPLLQDAILSENYDETFLIPLMKGTRYNQGFRRLILNDVIKARHLQNLLHNNNMDEKAEEIV